MTDRRVLMESIRLKLKLDLQILEEKAKVLERLYKVADADWSNGHTEMLLKFAQIK